MFKQDVPPDLSTFKIVEGICQARKEGKTFFCFTNWDGIGDEEIPNDIVKLKNAGFKVEHNVFEVSFDYVSEYKVSWNLLNSDDPFEGEILVPEKISRTDEIEIYKTLLDMYIKHGRRCFYDLKHAVDWIRDEGARKTCSQNMSVWETVFNPALDHKNYAIKIYKEIDRLEKDLESCRKLLRDMVSKSGSSVTFNWRIDMNKFQETRML